MKKLIFTLFTIAFIGTQVIAQHVQVDVKDDMNFAIDIDIARDFDLDLDLDLDLDFDFDFDYDFMHDFDFDFDFDMDLDIPTNFDYNFNSGFDWNLDVWDRGDGPSIKEDINIRIDKNELNDATEFIIKNINGDVKVTGYDGDEIIITGIKEVWKKRGDISDREASEVYINTELYEGALYAYIDAPYAYVEFKRGRMNYHMNWDDDNDRDRINFHFDLEIKVPNNLELRASTINGGEVYVEKMNNGVRANNVNGSVTVKDVIGYTTANTVNGNVEVWFLESPTSDLDFKTVNGSIEIYSPKDLSAIVTFESLHGELYTDFEQVKRLPNRLNKERDGNGYRYKINQSSPIQIGDGDIEMGFKMVNGSAYIRQRKS